MGLLSRQRCESAKKGNVTAFCPMVVTTTTTTTATMMMNNTTFVETHNIDSW